MIARRADTGIEELRTREVTDRSPNRPILRINPATFVGATHDDVRYLELDSRRADILSISSQLAYGRAGLNAALPILDERGLRYAAIPTAILSVLPHYPSTHRADLSAQWVTDTLADLGDSGALDALRAICVGYIATPAQAQAIAEWLRFRTGAARDVPLILDPILGDLGLGFYNDPRLAEPIRDLLAPHARGLTPNLFELAHLTEHSVDELTTTSEVETAARTLLTDATQWVVVTGLRSHDLRDIGAEDTIGELVITISTTELLTHPLLPRTPAGVGDTFTAALVSAVLEGVGLTEAAEHAAAVTARYIAEPARR
jgi:pyridoxine kinase